MATREPEDASRDCDVRRAIYPPQNVSGSGYPPVRTDDSAIKTRPENWSGVEPERIWIEQRCQTKISALNRTIVPALPACKDSYDSPRFVVEMAGSISQAWSLGLRVDMPILVPSGSRANRKLRLGQLRSKPSPHTMLLNPRRILPGRARDIPGLLETFFNNFV